MKRIFLYLLVLSLLGGCATKKVVGNTFYSSSPKLELEVSPDFKYVGERTHSKDVEEIHEGADFTLFHKAFVFQGPNRLVAITTLKAPDNAFWLEPSSGFAKIKNRLETGKCKLGKHMYSYCIFRVGNQLVKFHARNVYGGSVQVQIFYQEKENQKAISDRELLRQFNENCDAAFRVK